jgi:hypothetical protein
MAWVFDRYVKDRSLYPLQDAARSARAARSTSRCCARSASSPASRPACWRRRSPSSAPLGVDARIRRELGGRLRETQIAPGLTAELLRVLADCLVQQVTDAAHKDISGNGFAPFDPSRHAIGGNTQENRESLSATFQDCSSRYHTSMNHPIHTHPFLCIPTPHEHDVSQIFRLVQTVNALRAASPSTHRALDVARAR